jgi:hypothetical protein
VLAAVLLVGAPLLAGRLLDAGETPTRGTLAVRGPSGRNRRLLALPGRFPLVPPAGTRP